MVHSTINTPLTNLSNNQYRQPTQESADRFSKVEPRLKFGVKASDIPDDDPELQQEIKVFTTILKTPPEDSEIEAIKTRLAKQRTPQTGRNVSKRIK